MYVCVPSPVILILVRILHWKWSTFTRLPLPMLVLIAADYEATNVALWGNLCWKQT